MENPNVYSFAVVVDGRVRVIRTYGHSFKQALEEIEKRLGVEPTAVIGVRARRCTNKRRGK